VVLKKGGEKRLRGTRYQGKPWGGGKGRGDDLPPRQRARNARTLRGRSTANNPESVKGRGKSTKSGEREIRLAEIEGP